MQQEDFVLADPAVFAPVAGFMGLPAPSARAPAPAACVLGIPFDCGTHPFRVGSRQGPDAIREQSRLLRPFDLFRRAGVDNPSQYLRAVDAGNVVCWPGDPERSYPAIEEAVGRILDAGAIPVTMGGDGAVTLPQLRAAGKRHPGLVVLHFDSHTDTYPIPGYNTATTFTRAAEEALIDVGASFHVGTRGNSFMGGVVEYGREVGYRVIPFDDFDQDQGTVLDEIKRRVGDRPVYLCFDMDVFDPSCAPGVCTPEWGGLSAKEGLALLRRLSGLNFVAFDVNTVSPPQDVGGATAFLAATVMQEFLALAAAAVRRPA
ncbi:agmatinase/arginase [Bordetella hinzii]|nr:Proclavaminate amidinohydrolase [Bordetella hinzii]KCB24778.1 putative agmatinase [Bordetella hinzii OH87 BAL007II]KCB27129.1 putative agmatinase [Bordetella hinzii CA90 BAL1384]KCB31803.1 putative agmatinase [Bordetella hinzii L60]KCB44266.1 putative agmatinase [Bordetella hinzii 5132]KCB48101.1 putative agmatinase [Bordetella hinzii 4161]KCB51776.1 putative agmatinase [Bordetella hinzii 1277]